MSVALTAQTPTSNAGMAVAPTAGTPTTATAHKTMVKTQSALASAAQQQPPMPNDGDHSPAIATPSTSDSRGTPSSSPPSKGPAARAPRGQRGRVASQVAAAAATKGPGNGRGRKWTIDEQVALCKSYVVETQRDDKGTDWSKDQMWEAIRVDFKEHTPSSLTVAALKRLWTSRTARSMTTQFERHISPDCQRFAHFCFLPSSKERLTGGLTEDDIIRAAAGLYSGASA